MGPGENAGADAGEGFRQARRKRGLLDSILGGSTVPVIRTRRLNLNIDSLSHCNSYSGNLSR
jgi:hypothetical protein